jgi:hypothetical protein
MAMIAKLTRRRRPIHGPSRDGCGKLRKELAERGPWAIGYVVPQFILLGKEFSSGATVINLLHFL